MAPRTRHRLRHALRLVASVFLLSSPCGGAAAQARWVTDAPVTSFTELPAGRAIFAAAYRPLR